MSVLLRQPGVLGRKRDEVFDAEVRRRQRLGELGMESADQTLDGYVCGTWAQAHAMHLAAKTRKVYAGMYDRHIEPRLGHVRLREINPEIVARFQGDLIAAGVGPQAVKKSVTLLGGILQRAAESRPYPLQPRSPGAKGTAAHTR